MARTFKPAKNTNIVQLTGGEIAYGRIYARDGFTFVRIMGKGDRYTVYLGRSIPTAKEGKLDFGVVGDLQFATVTSLAEAHDLLGTNSPLEEVNAPPQTVNKPPKPAKQPPQAVKPAVNNPKYPAIPEPRRQSRPRPASKPEVAPAYVIPPPDPSPYIPVYDDNGRMTAVLLPHTGLDPDGPQFAPAGSYYVKHIHPNDPDWGTGM
jgi:hypothetical protein